MMAAESNEPVGEPPNRPSLYHRLSLDPDETTLCDGSIVLGSALTLLVDLAHCVEWEFHSPKWLVWKPAWAQRQWSSSWLPSELQREHGRPAKRLELALRTDEASDWVYGGGVILMSHGWGSGDAPWSGHADANFELLSPLSGTYWPELKYWRLMIDGHESEWSGGLHLPVEVEAGWSEIEAARKCGDKLLLKRTRGRVYMTYLSPSSATAHGRSDYGWLSALTLFHTRNLLLPTVHWRWSGDATSALVRFA